VLRAVRFGGLGRMQAACPSGDHSMKRKVDCVEQLEEEFGFVLHGQRG